MYRKPTAISKIEGGVAGASFFIPIAGATSTKIRIPNMLIKKKIEVITNYIVPFSP